MNAPTTRKPVVTTDVFGNTLTLNFITGQELSIDVGQLSDEIRTQAMLHGLKQKLVDAAAIARNPDTGLSATPDDKYHAVKTVYDRITRADGTWNSVREGVERQTGGVFIRAVMELMGRTKAQVEVWLAKLSKEEVAALKKNPRILAITQRMEREAAAALGNTGDDLLAALAASDMEEEPVSAPTPEKGKGK